MKAGPIIVQKYGGTSVASAEKMRRIAERVAALHQDGARLVVVVSALGVSTDELLRLARDLSKDPQRRELDLLLSTGEQASAALLAMAIQAVGVPAVALTGPQCGIVTNNVHTNARILEIHPRRLLSELAAGAVVVAAGFQGLSREGELTTLGRGGSDTSAVALAAALGAEACEIFTDVEGVFSADPRRVPNARSVPELGHREMQELAWQGARVLKAEAVEFARDNGIDLGVGCGAGGLVASWIRQGEEGPEPVWKPRRRPVSGVAGRRDLLRLQASEGLFLEDLEGLLRELGRYDLVFGRLPAPGGPWSLYLSDEEIPDGQAFAGWVRDLSAGKVVVEGPFGGVSLVGFGLGSRPQSLWAAAMALAGSGIETLDSWTSRESLSFVVPWDAVEKAVLLLHRSFVTAYQEAERDVLFA